MNKTEIAVALLAAEISSRPIAWLEITKGSRAQAEAAVNTAFALAELILEREQKGGQ